MTTGSEWARMAVTEFVWQKKELAELEQEVEDRLEIYKEALAELKSHLRETHQMKEYIEKRKKAKA